MSRIDDLKKYAKNLEFDMNEKEYETLDKEFDVLLKQMDMLENLKDIKSYEPMDFPFALDSVYLRSDEVSMGLESEDAFSNAKDVKDGCVKCPRVVS